MNRAGGGEISGNFGCNNVNGKTIFFPNGNFPEKSRFLEK